MRPFLVALIISLLIVPALHANGTIEPPMWVASQSPLQSLHLGLLPAVPRRLEPGEWSVQRTETWTNVPMRVGRIERTVFLGAVQPMSAHTALAAQYLCDNGPDFGFHFGITHDVQRRR